VRTAVACVAVALGASSCAAIVGADFGDESLAAGAPDGQAGFDALAPLTDSSRDTGTNKDAGGHPQDASLADGNTCPSGLAACSDDCVDTTSNPDHCGACANACPDDPNGAGVCVKSRCTFACNVGWVECAGGCCSTTSDDAGSDAAADDAGDPGILCSGARCAVASNSFCCGGGNGPDVCDTNLNDNCPVEVFCDNAVECQGMGVCCYDFQQAATFCDSQCSQNEVQLCDPKANGECQSGTQCTGTLTPAATSYSSCQ
jgi:hypothetical protein